MDEPEDDLTLVYMWASKQAEKKYKGRIEELEAALRKIIHEDLQTTRHADGSRGETVFDGYFGGIARTALGEKK
jgi:hypothetical protein